MRTKVEKTFVKLLIKIASSKGPRKEDVWNKLWLRPISKISPEVVLLADEVLKENP
jgi:hypothetical protein